MRTEKTGDDCAPATVALTCDGRDALDRSTAVLRQLSRAAGEEHQAPAPGLRAADADRDAAAAALGEHFAQGRLTLGQLDARLNATLTATMHGELSQAAQDLPDLTVVPARVSLPRRSGQDQGASPGRLQAKEHGRGAAAEPGARRMKKRGSSDRQWQSP